MHLQIFVHCKQVCVAHCAVEEGERGGKEEEDVVQF